MNNKDLYKDIMSYVHPSEHSVERIMDMANDDNKKRNIIKPILAVFACVALLVTSVLSGVIFISKNNSNKSNLLQKNAKINNLFILTAHAEENENQKIIKSSKYIMQNSKIKMDYDSDGSIIVSFSGESNFEVSGENIKTVRYQCDNGKFGLLVDFNKKEYLIQQNQYFDAIIPYSEDLQNKTRDEFNKIISDNFLKGEYDEYFKMKKSISDYIDFEKIYDESDKVVGVGFVSEESFQNISSHESKDFTFVNHFNRKNDFNYAHWEPSAEMYASLIEKGRVNELHFEELEHDKLTITVEFNDGEIQTESYDLGFNKNGNLEIQIIK